MEEIATNQGGTGGFAPSTLAVSIIIPMRNEAHYIGRCLDSVLANDFPEEDYEILVADGESEDRSREIVLEKAGEHAGIRLLHNPGRFVPSGMNICLRQARGRFIIRMDAHSEYPSDYIRNCVAELERTGAGNVGGRWITRPGSNTWMAKAIAWFTQSRIGVGNAHYRLGRGGRYVDTVPFGAFPREVFDRVGLFHEELIRNQDFELNTRIRSAGYGIYLSDKISNVYYNSPTFRKFMRQAWLNGTWLPRMWAITRASFCWRHAAPLALVAGLLMSLGLGLIFRPLLWLGLAGAGIYLATALGLALRIGARNGWRCVPYVFLLMPSYHSVYGLGTIVGLMSARSRKDSGPSRERFGRKPIAGLMLKRLFDFIAALAGLLLFSPLMLAIAVAIKLAMPGPVFYSGERVGLDGRIFGMHKFRSMVVGADQLGGPCVAEGDPRVTRLGRFLRKAKLDELPQLWNVLKGEMSLVGPRPEVEEYVRMYTREERAILGVRPGITDRASIWDRDEAIVLAQSPDAERAYRELILPEKKRLQLEYVRQRCFVSDLSILFVTLKILLFRSPAPSSPASGIRGKSEHILRDC